MRADLHLHSVFSDGKYPPRVLAKMAKARGLALFSVTDHDNMGGAEEAAAAARAIGLHFVRGWEVSAYEGDVKVHMLGYGCRADGTYRKFLEERYEAGKLRAENSLRRANEYFGTDLTLNDVEAYHVRKDTPIHTMHIVSAFAEKLGREKGELFREAFAWGGPAYAGEGRPTPEEALCVIHATGGIAVLAHPGRIRCLTQAEYAEYRGASDVRRTALDGVSNARRDALISRLTAAGIDGIECFYPTHTEEETKMFSGYAEAHGLFVTGGSDFHAEGAEAVLGLPRFEADEALSERLSELEGSV